MHGSEWNGRKRKGAVDYRQDLVQALTRKMPSADVIASYGGNPVAAVEADPEARALVAAIAHQDHLVALLQQFSTAITEAYAVASNGAEYETPAQRAQRYAEQEKSQAKNAAAIEGLLAAFRPQA